MKGRGLCWRAREREWLQEREFRVGWIPWFEKKRGLGRAVPWMSQERKFEMVHVSRKKQTSQIQDG